jgi:hypothetical protein
MSLEDISLEARDELALLAKQLSDNPETRKEFLRLTQRVKPDMVIPELQLEDFTNKKVNQAEERVMQLENKLREKDIREHLESKRRALKANGIARTDEDIQEIEKIMLEQGITSHDTAAQHWEWMKQAATPTPTGYNPNIINKFDLSKYWKNPQGAARNEAATALQEIRNNGRRPIGV